MPRLPIFRLSRFTLHVSFLIISIFLIAWGSSGLIREGNRYYARGQYSSAIEKYRKAKDSPIVHYNLGNAFYKQQKYKEAIEEYRRVLVTEDRNLREKAYYNIGNAQFKLGVLRLAIRSYKNALKLKPNDLEAKYNLEYALRELKRKEQDSLSKSNKSKKDKRKQSNANKKKQEKANLAQDKYQPQKSKTSREDIKRVLNAIRKEEKKLQRELLYRKLLEAKKTMIEKDW